MYTLFSGSSEMKIGVQMTFIISSEGWALAEASTDPQGILECHKVASLVGSSHGAGLAPSLGEVRK